MTGLCCDPVAGLGGGPGLAVAPEQEDAEAALKNMATAKPVRA
jgi:hypothetical protein